MGSRHENSTQINDEDDNNANGVSGADVAVTAVAGAAALAVWGLSKLFGSSKPVAGAVVLAVWGLSKLFGSSKLEENNMMMASTVSRDCYNPEHRSSIYDDDNKWTKPENGWFKLNIDASVLHEHGNAVSAGGLIRDHTGEWIVGFTARLEPCDIISAELQAVREGLKLAWKRGLKKVKIETDSEQAVDLIKNPKVNPKNYSFPCIIEECRNLMKRDFELNNIPREKNRCANALAKMGRSHYMPLIILNETPENVRRLVSDDMNN